MFMEFGFREGGSAETAFREGFALVDAAESWGLDSAWLAEFHFSPDRSVLSSPIVTAAAMAARTKRMRIGTAVYVLPLTNPLRIAEEVATVDQISEGRFDFGIGRSGFTGQYDAYNIDYADSQGRFTEAVDILLAAWSGEKFSYKGKHFQVNDALVVPQPVQRPHPPLRIAAASASTYETVARQGVPLFVGLRGDGLDTLKNFIGVYRRTWKEAGHAGDGSVYLRVPIYAAKTERAAIEEPKKSIIWYFERQANLVAARGRNQGSAQQAQTVSTLKALSFDDIVETRACFGTAAQIIDKLQEWQDVLGIDGIIIETNAGGLLSEQQVLDSMRIVTHDIMPAFK
jgi:alkanesulfonate monooxygenase SsuD/methylene tetrahydromethanopterin reductase-like flavin-dependent oxidoreductase (luciferase family)